MSQDFPRPWHTDHEAVKDRPWGMLFDVEASLLFHLARDHFHGYGEIVDAGTFLGGSSFSLAKGLEQNSSILHKTARIHAFDLFEIWHENISSDEEMANSIFANYGVDLRDGETFIHIYAKNLGDLCRNIRIYRGDIRRQEWCGRPIEILFIDICKDLQIFKHTVAQFYRSLIPGISVLIHQDYHHPLLPYIHIGQERLAKYFEVFELQADTSHALRLLDRIPDRLINEVSEFPYDRKEQLKLIDAAIERLPEAHRHHIRLAKAVLLAQHGERKKGAELLEFVVAHSGDVSWDHTLKYSISACEQALAYAADGLCLA